MQVLDWFSKCLKILRFSRYLQYQNSSVAVVKNWVRRKKLMLQLIFVNICKRWQSETFPICFTLNRPFTCVHFYIGSQMTAEIWRKLQESSSAVWVKGTCMTSEVGKAKSRNERSGRLINDFMEKYHFNCLVRHEVHIQLLIYKWNKYSSEPTTSA